MDALEEAVYAAVAEERGIRRNKLRPTTRLNRDLGMEGDDAVEFFDAFSQQFRVDLRQLGEGWHIYFAPEGTPPLVVALVAIPPAFIVYIAAKMVPRFPTWALFVGALVLWLVVLARWSRWRNKSSPQITIQDLVDSAKAGTWAKRGTR